MYLRIWRLIQWSAAFFFSENYFYKIEMAQSYSCCQTNDCLFQTNCLSTLSLPKHTYTIYIYILHFGLKHHQSIIIVVVVVIGSVAVQKNIQVIKAVLYFHCRHDVALCWMKRAQPSALCLHDWPSAVWKEHPNNNIGFSSYIWLKRLIKIKLKIWQTISSKGEKCWTKPALTKCLPTHKDWLNIIYKIKTSNDNYNKWCHLLSIICWQDMHHQRPPHLLTPPHAYTSSGLHPPYSLTLRPLNVPPPPRHRKVVMTTCGKHRTVGWRSGCRVVCGPL